MTCGRTRQAVLLDPDPHLAARRWEAVGRETVRVTLVILGLGMLSGCAHVRAYEREHLADPIMALDSEHDAEGREQRWLEAREGSSGGAGGAGGGCACK